MNRRQSRRRGVSLVETLVVITLGAVVLGSVANGMAALTRVNQRVHNQANAIQQAERVVQALRADLGRAGAVTWDPQQNLLTIQTPDAEAVTYECPPGRLLRSQGESAVAFRLPDGAGIEAPTSEASEPDVYNLTLRLDDAHRLPVAVRLGRCRWPLTESRAR